MEKGNNNQQETEIALRSIKSLFETGNINRMYDLVKLYPTKVRIRLNLNHGRYVEKLASPEKFSVSEVVRFALLVGVDPNKVWELIAREVIPNIKASMQNEEAKTAKKYVVTKKKAIKKKRA